MKQKIEGGKKRSRDLSGRYDYDDLSLVCICGHTLGDHCAQNDTRIRDCMVEQIRDGEECDCPDFKKAKPMTTKPQKIEGGKKCNHAFRGPDDLHWNCIKCGIKSREIGWEEEFDNKFGHWDVEFEMGCEFLLNNTDGKCNCEHDEVKIFISNLLASERQRCVERVREMTAEAVNETTKEHGSPNVYIDMVGEILDDKLSEMEEKK